MGLYTSQPEVNLAEIQEQIPEPTENDLRGWFSYLNFILKGTYEDYSNLFIFL